MSDSIVKDRDSGHYDDYWRNVENSYAHYPTIRHRERFIVSCIRSLEKKSSFSLFDFGCGDGRLLKVLQDMFGIQEQDIGGSDISPVAIQRSQSLVPQGEFTLGAFPQLKRRYDVVLCSEVIEHTERYAEALRWIFENLSDGGTLLLTTQAGVIHASDRYTGHTQHFVLKDLVSLLKEIGYEIQSARLWGFPFFTLQKYMTDWNFERVRTQYLEGGVSWKKKFVFSAMYLLSFMHDLIPFGPQIYIVAKRPRA